MRERDIRFLSNLLKIIHLPSKRNGNDLIEEKTKISVNAFWYQQAFIIDNDFLIHALSLHAVSNNLVSL